MQRRKSFFNNEMEQRFSLRKYTIGLCSVCLGFVTIGMGSQSVKADTVNNVEKSPVVQENKMQDADSATAKPNTTPTETKKNEVGSVATTAPKTNTTSNGVKANTADSATSTEIKPQETKLAKTADTNNTAVVNTSDQSKSEDSSAVAPTSEKTQLQTSQDSSIKAKGNSLNNKSNAMKAVAKFINLNEKSNSSDPNSKDVEVKPKESSNVDTNEQKKVTWHDTFHWVYADKDDPDNPILHKAEDNLAGKKFADDTVVTITFTPKDGKYSTDGIEVSQTGPKLNLTGITDLGATTSATDNKTNHTFRLSFDYNSVPVPQGYDLAHSEYQQTFTLEEGDGKLSHQTPDRETTVAVYKRNSQTLTIKYVDDDENGRNIFDPDTLTTKEGDTVVTNIQDNLKKLENYILVPNQNLPETITVGNKAIDPIVVHLKHKTEQREVTKDFVQSASFSLSGLWGAGLSKSPNSYEYIAGQEVFIKGTQKYDLVTERFLGEATWDYNHIYQGNGNDDDATEAKDLDAINSLGDLDKTYINEGSIYSPDHPQYKEQHEEQYNELGKLISKAYDNGVISTQTWLKDGLHADGYYLSEKTSLVFDGKSWLNLKEYQEKVDPNFTWTTTSSPEVMQGDHAVDHINPEKLTLDLLPKLDSGLDSGATGMDSGREIFLNYVPYTYKHHSAQRTINIHLPNGEVKTVSQKADAKQPVFTVYTLPDARNDKLPSQETGNWTGGEWAEYDAPVVAGYTATQPTVSAKTVTGDTQNETIDITYVASEHTSHVKLVDNDNKTIQDTPVMGKTGETANVSVTVPKGWQLSQGQELPTQISFNAEGHPDVVVQIEHKTIKVTPDNPKENGTVLPDNPSLHFNGVSHDDLNKTVTREVTITDPTGKKSTTTQTVTFTRGATVDEVTNKVTYDDWSENGKHTFDKVDVPTVPGYTASQNEVPATEVTSDMTDQTIDISYTANSQTIHINYVDDEKADKIVYTTAVTGKTGETVSLNLTVPDKYQLADGQQLPTTYTFTAGSGDATIYLAHKVVQREATVDVQIGFMTLVDVDDESDPGIVVTQNQWKQLDDEIKKSYTTHLEKVDPTVGVVGTLTGHVNYDLVDNKVVSFADDWTSLNLGGQTYQMPDGTDVVNGVMLNSSIVWGKKLKERLLKYWPDADPDYATRPWYGYLSVNKSNIDSDWAGFRLVGNESNALAKATGDRAATAIEMTNKPIDLSSLRENNVMGGGLSDFNEQDGQLRAKAIVPVGGMYIPYVEKTATRTINVTTPDGKTTSVKQTATLAKQVTAQENAHPDWTTSEWTSYDVPVIPGYTASQSNVAKEAVTGTTKDQTVNITYTANDGTQTIVYQDEDGSKIGKQVVSGKTDETIKVTPDVPDGYVLKGEVPSKVTIKPDDTPITVTVEHGKSHVTPDKPVNKGDLIPDTKDKHYPEGLTHNDLNKTVTREITITDPTGKKSTITQTVTFTRGATVDEVTNKVTYDDWSENGKHTFDKVDVPTVSGYTVSGEVPEVVVTPETQSSKVDITYAANAQTATITYIDDTEKKSLGSDKQNGKFNQVITFEHDPAEVIKGLEEKGYKLVSNDFNSNKYQADNSNNVFYVHLKHGTSESSRKDDVNMTVHYVMDDGSKAPSDSKQTVSFTESGIKDNVTGNITWMPVASQTLKDIDSPMLTGYTADIKTANGKVVNFGDPDINVTVHYSANAQTATITYIDDTEKKTLGSDKQNGKFNQVITFEHDPAEVIKGLEEKGYKLVSNDFKPGIKYQNDNKSNSFEVHLVHTYEPVETSQTITETVHYIDANGKPVAPDHVATVVVKVTGTRDKVTDSITWNTPSTGHFDKVISPKLPNMIPDKKLIPGRDVQYGDSDITESVVYTPDEIPSEPEEPNKPDNSTSKTPEEPNKPSNLVSKTSEKPNKPSNLASKTSEKPNKSSKEVSKQFGTIAKTTIPEKAIDSRTVDNHVSAKSTAKQELPQTGATTNTGIWTGLVSMIAGLGLVGASKKRKKN